MTRRPYDREALARKAAAAAGELREEPAAAPDPAPVPEPDPAPAPESPPEAEPPPKNKGGRPRGRARPVANKQTVYLDERRYRALVRAAEDRGRSIHSIILEGIDLMTGKPSISTWD